jgi:uroporphyrinogen-III synthase
LERSFPDQNRFDDTFYSCLITFSFGVATMSRSGFSGLTVAAFESRMAKEMAALIRRYGGEPLVAPALREVPLENNAEALEAGERLMAGHFEMVIFLTGVGTKTMMEILRTRYQLEAIRMALARTTLVARGPKPVAVLTEFGLTSSITVPEPNTWKDIVRILDQSGSLVEVRIAVQEYGVSNQDFLDALRQRGAHVTRVPVYRWALPDDTGPLKNVLQEMLAGHAQVLLVTNAVQIDHVMQLLEQEGKVEPFKEACSKMVLASIGPTASERLRHYGLPVDLVPPHSKMGILVKATSERAHALLQRKQSV